MTISQDAPTAYTPEAIEQSLLEVRRVFARMPYGGLLAHPSPTTLGGIVDTLDELRAVLEGVAERANAAEAELLELQRQRAAMRAFLGTAD